MKLFAKVMPHQSRQSGQSGQVVPLMALIAIVIVGFVGLATDSAIAYGHQRGDHNVADAGALAGARDLSLTWNAISGTTRKNSTVTAIQSVVTQNGFPTNSASLDVQPTLFDGTLLADNPANWLLAQGVQVKVSGTFDTAFFRALGVNQATAAATAKAIYGYPTGVFNVVPIQIASDAPQVGVTGVTDCMSPANEPGTCSTNFTPFQPTPMCPTATLDPNYDPCFAQVVASGLTAAITLKQKYPSRLWNGSLKIVPPRAAWQLLDDRYKAAPTETWDKHATNSPRVFFATVGTSDSGNGTIEVDVFQCVFLGNAEPTSGNFTVTYLDSCVTTAPPGTGLSKDPPGTGSGNLRSAVVIKLID
jgi:hypothetical protein